MTNRSHSNHHLQTLADTLCRNDVILTSMQRNDVITMYDVMMTIAIFRRNKRAHLIMSGRFDFTLHSSYHSSYV